MLPLINRLREKWKWRVEANYIDWQIRYKERAWFFRQTFDYFKCRNQLQGDYYEFGCHKALTFRMALKEARRRNIHWMDFWAFDSFEGLPKPTGLDAEPIWEEGAFATTEEEFLRLIRKQGIFLDRIHTVKGFYSESLTSTLQEQLRKKSKIALAFIDCDLYSSTRDVLHFIEPLLQPGSVVYFDDFYMFRGDPTRGEQRAFSEFKSVTRRSFDPHLQIGWFGRSFIAT